MQHAVTPTPRRDTTKPPESPARRWKIRQLVYGEALTGLDAVFAGLGIEYMPMKGAHLLCTGLAGKFPAREMHDIDLLIRPIDFSKTIALLCDHPQFTLEPPDPWEFEQSFVYRHGNHEVHFELHRALNRPERFTLDTNELFDRATFHTAKRRIMSAEDALVILVCHTLVHLVDGIPAHAFKEASILSSVPGFSWEQFELLLSKTGISRFGRGFLTMATENDEIGLPSSLLARHIEKALLRFKSPGRKNGIRTILFRGTIEVFFAARPAALLRTIYFTWERWLQCKHSFPEHNPGQKPCTHQYDVQDSN